MNINYFSKVKILDGGMGQTLLAKGLKAKGSLWSATALIEKKSEMANFRNRSIVGLLLLVILGLLVF